MGILDSGSRWMDVVITDEGRRALAEGDFDVVYYAFSDRSSSYPVDGDVGGIRWLADPKEQVLVEAVTCLNNTNTLRTNDFGEVQEHFSVDDPIGLVGSRLLRTTEPESSVRYHAPNRNTRPGDYPDVALPIDRHYPIEQSREAALLPQLAFLPPVISRGSTTEPLAQWVPSVPSAEPLSDDFIDLALRERPVAFQADMNRATLTVQAFVRDRSTLAVKPLLMIEQTTNEPGVRVWSAGEIIVANDETHFFRLLRIIFRPTTEEP